MDAYTSYILAMTNRRLRELRTEAAERSLSRAARSRRPAAWRRALALCAGRRAGGTEPVGPVGLRGPLPQPDFDLFA